MSTFADSYIGKLRTKIGHDMLLVPGARVLVFNPQNEILLQLRSDFHCWGTIGGAAEPGESIVETARREAFEEAGIALNEVTIFGLSSNPENESVTYPNGDQCQFFITNCVATGVTATPRINDDESLELRWFALDNLPEVLPNTTESLEAYQRYVETGEFQLY